MKLYQESIVVTKQGGLPSRVIWRLRPYQVLEIQERWLWNGRWWTTPGLTGERRRYYRLVVAAANGTRLVMEVYEDRSNCWMLSRLED